MEYSFYEPEFVLLTHKHAFAEAVVNLPAVGRLNCNLFNADFSAASAKRAETNPD